MTNTKDLIDSDGQPLGTWLSIGHPKVAEGVAQLDLDFVLVDMEHTTMTLETVGAMARGVDAANNGTDTIVRVPWNDPVRLKRAVDIGVAGVMVPMIDSAEEARALVESIRYPPEGVRGIAGSRATGYGRNFEEYVTNANGTILTIAQIETEAGLENVEEIAKVDGIDALFVGPADLSSALGMFAEWDSEEFVEAIQPILDASATTGVPVGTLTVDIDTIDERLAQGFDFLITGKDISLLMESVDQAIGDYSAALEKQTPSSSTD